MLDMIIRLNLDLQKGLQHQKQPLPNPPFFFINTVQICSLFSFVLMYESVLFDIQHSCDSFFLNVVKLFPILTITETIVTCYTLNNNLCKDQQVM